MGIGLFLFHDHIRGFILPVDGNEQERLHDIGDFCSCLFLISKRQGVAFPDKGNGDEFRIRIGTGRNDGDDEFLDDAVSYVISAEQASVSSLQRKFKIGYNRAARLVDVMEERGIVGPPDGARPRKVLITQDQYEQMKKASESEE